MTCSQSRKRRYMSAQYVNHMIQYASGGKETFKGKRVAISGSGNVAQYAALKAIELGATIVSLSDSKGSIIAESDKGISPDDVAYIADLKVKRKQLTELADSDSYKGKFKYIEGARPWKNVDKVDVALPCATQNEVSGEEGQALIDAGAKFIAEGSNMGCSQEAIGIFENHRKEKKGEAIWYGPGTSDLPLLPKKRQRFLTPLSPSQAKQPMPAASPCPDSRWPRTPNA